MDLFRINPKLISIHVPKTAGSTFHKILKDHYGIRLKHIQRQQDMHIWNNGLPYRCNKPWVEAIHGHITAHPNWIAQYPESRLIAWVRDPAERVISAYYHWKKEIDHRDDRHKLFAELKPDLPGFARMPEFAPTVNALQTYLGGVSPSAYFFIGRTEYFDADLIRLCEKMNWSLPSYKRLNSNANKPEVSGSVVAELQSILKDEYDLYRELLRENEHPNRV